MVPQMDIIRPGRGIIQEGVCVMVDCVEGEVRLSIDFGI